MPSTTPQYKVEVLTSPSSLHAWTAAQFSSFVGTGNVLHDVFFPPAIPPTPSELTLAVKRHESAFKDGDSAKLTGNVFIQILDESSGKVMGGAKWQLHAKNPKRPSDVTVDWVDTTTERGVLEQKFAQKAMDEFMGRRAKDMSVDGHGLLDLCYTVPEYERKGVATALVQWGLEILDREGWVGFTEASPRGGPVYERLGFEKVEVVRLRYDEVDGLEEYAKGMGDVVWTYMVRPAKKK